MKMSLFAIICREINVDLKKMYPKNMYMRLIRTSGSGNCLFLHSRGWGIYHQERKKIANPRGYARKAW